MKRLAQLNGMLLALLLLASTAFAYPVLGPNQNEIEFINFENVYHQVGGQWVARGPNDSLAIGDVFVGIIRAQTITNNGVPVWSADEVGAPGTLDTLTGYFINTVTGFDVPNNVIYLGASSVDPLNTGVFTAQDFTDGVVMKLFTDTQTAMNPTTVMGGIATATDGALWASLSLNGGYWWSDAAPQFGSSGPIGENWFGFNVVDGVLGGLQKINDPLETLYNLSVDIYGVSRINFNTVGGTTGAWLFASNDPATLATPEPATLLIMGSGLLGLYGARRRRKA